MGSFLSTPCAQVWAALADTLPILIYILSYIYIATTRFYGRPVWQGALAVVLFVPYSAAVSAGLGAVIGDLNGSISYVPVPILIAAYAFGLRKSALSETARGLAIGAGILVVSLAFRSVDMAVCGAVPLGTHFMWHILNGVMLAWMIRVAVGKGIVAAMGIFGSVPAGTFSEYLICRNVNAGRGLHAERAPPQDRQCRGGAS